MTYLKWPKMTSNDLKWSTTILRLWKRKHPQKSFQNFRQSCVLLTDRIEIHQLQPLVWPSNLLYIMLSGCDWWISIRSVNNMHEDWWQFCTKSFQKNPDFEAIYHFRVDSYHTLPWSQTFFLIFLLFAKRWRWVATRVYRFVALSQLSHAEKNQGKPLWPG